jgi:GGDEF domain-containing protein
VRERRWEQPDGENPPDEGDPLGQRTVEPVVERGGEPSVSLTDTQTGLLDRPGFVRYADLAMQDHGKAGMNVAVVLVDCAPKNLPVAGPSEFEPTLLNVLVDLLRDCFRPGDVIARWSDAAFVALLAGDDLDAENLRSSVSLRLVSGAGSVEMLAYDIAVGVGSSTSLAKADLNALVRLAFADVANDRRQRLGWP